MTGIARIQSVNSSNAIENVTAHRRIVELVADKTTPADRSEEIAGYCAVLDTIHASAEHIPFTPSVVEQLRHDLYDFASVPAGRWRRSRTRSRRSAPTGPK